MLAARHAALMILDHVLTRRQPLDTAFEAVPGFAALPVRDRAFVRMLAATVLRRLGQIDDILRQASQRDDTPEPVLLHHLIRIGIAQILFMDVPDYAAVDTSVRLAEQVSLARQGGFVNAVLRHVTRSGPAWVKAQEALLLNTPDWMFKSWTEDYGLPAAASIAAAHLSEAPLDITVRHGADRDYWARELQAEILPTGTLRRASGGLVQDMPGYHDGQWWIQDMAAALPAQLLGAVRGQTVLDLCAAPGGKAAQLAAMGANVVALDRSAKRLKRLKENIARLRLDSHVRTEVADASSWMPREPASHVLLDAPCTATGTARRNPDVPWLKTPQDMETLVNTQSRLLDNAARMLAPGGLLIYCTCSLQKAEGEAQVDAFLRRSPTFARLPVQPAEIGGLEEMVTPHGDVRALPFYLAERGGIDGFYIARLQRR
jgi:16S rRNA (cytosine967-C5)-methyltransferase